MRVLVFVKAIEGGDKIGEPTPEALEAFAAMDRFTEELVQAGIFVAAAGLKNNGEAKRLSYDGSRLTVTDGPFAETKEQLLGFVMVEAADLAEALEIADGIPLAELGTIEVRAIYDIPGS